MAASLNRNIFRQYDIRGLIDQDLTTEVVELIGRSFGSRVRERGGRSVAIGYDVRESSPLFADALARGLASTGLEVIDIGLVATPILYFSIFHLDADGGIMITGSHNPVPYNGLKICDGKWPLHGDDIVGLHDRIQEGSFVSGEGGVRRENVVPAYSEQLRKRFDSDLAARVVVDAGNGTAGTIFPPILRELGCDVDELCCEPDGRFPNHLPDPENPANVEDLVARVVEIGADVGLGFDGDSDRVGVITNRGEPVSADRLLLLFARHYLTENRGGKIIYDVKCSDILEEEIRAAGGVPILWRTGHSLIKKKMREEDALVAGELSGHIMVYKDYYGFDDAFFAALLTLQIRRRSGRSVHDLFADMPKTFTTHEVKVACADERKFEIVRTILERARKTAERVIDIDGARIIYPDGWSLVRASNTTPNLTLRFESRTPEGLERVIERTEQLFDGLADCDLTGLRKVREETVTS